MWRVATVLTFCCVCMIWPQSSHAQDKDKKKAVPKKKVAGKKKAETKKAAKKTKKGKLGSGKSKSNKPATSTIQRIINGMRDVTDVVVGNIQETQKTPIVSTVVGQTFPIHGPVNDRQALLHIAVPHGTRVQLSYDYEEFSGVKDPLQQMRITRRVIWLKGSGPTRHIQLPLLRDNQETKVSVKAWRYRRGSDCQDDRMVACKSVYIMNGEQRYVLIGQTDFKSQSR